MSDKGTLIYQPKGAAGEYAKWAVNLHNGCTHGCTYCYNRRGVLSHAFGEEPKLAAPIKKLVLKIKQEMYDRGISDSEIDDVKVTKCAIQCILHSDYDKLRHTTIREDGIFLSFTSDPLCDECHQLTDTAVWWCIAMKIPVTLLTKSVNFVPSLQLDQDWATEEYKRFVTIGFTLTGMDEMEPHAPANDERIQALSKLHEMGVKTFVSLEPVIRFELSLKMIRESARFCHEFRIGLQSPYKKDRYGRSEFINFIRTVHTFQLVHNLDITWKQSVLDELRRKNIRYKMIGNTLIV